ncbi:MAG: hypothetical protein JW751_27095 [Polyangiaceae bacterium]|nr:hypothetical protein [Polyangiaceae bacterium]
MFRHSKCPGCGVTYSGKTGESDDTKIVVYVGVSLFAVLFVAGPICVVGPDHLLESLVEWRQEARWSLREELTFIPGPVAIGASAGDECVVGLARVGGELFVAGVSSSKNEDRFRVGPLKTANPQAIQFAVAGASFVGILTPEHRFTVVSCDENRVFSETEFPEATRLCAHAHDGTFGLEESGFTRFVRYDGTSPPFFSRVELPCPDGEFDSPDSIPDWIPNELAGYQVLAKLGSIAAFATLYSHRGGPGKYALTYRGFFSRAWYDHVAAPEVKVRARTPLMDLSAKQIAVSYEAEPNLTHVALYDRDSSGDRVWDVALPELTPYAPAWKVVAGDENIYVLRGGRMDILRIGNGQHVGTVGGAGL